MLKFGRTFLLNKNIRFFSQNSGVFRGYSSKADSLSINNVIQNIMNGESLNSIELVKNDILSRKRSMKLYKPLDKSSHIGFVRISKKQISIDDAHVLSNLYSNLKSNENNCNMNNMKYDQLIAIVPHENIALPAMQILRLAGIDLVTPHTIAYQTNNNYDKNELTSNSDISTSSSSISSISDSLPLELQKLLSEQPNFNLKSPFPASSHQIEAVKNISDKINNGNKFQTLLGATGTGKTFMMASVVANVTKPTLVLAPNKVLAAQLVNELKEFLPDNAVEFFVSYYDYYLPEAYRSSTDTYIDKVVQINEDIDRMRHSATRSLLERRDVIVVSSISCIYGLGMPAHYAKEALHFITGESVCLIELKTRLKKLSYSDILDRDEMLLENNLLDRHEADHNDNNGNNGGQVGRGQFSSSIVSDGKMAYLEVGPAADDFNVRLTLNLNPAVPSEVESNRQGNLWRISAIDRVHRESGVLLSSLSSSSSSSISEFNINVSDDQEKNKILNFNSSSSSSSSSSSGSSSSQIGEEQMELMEELQKMRDQQVAIDMDTAVNDKNDENDKNDNIKYNIQGEGLALSQSWNQNRATIYPASHHVVSSEEKEVFLSRVEEELKQRYNELSAGGYLLEAQRLQTRTEADLLMLRALGTCKGIENYSRHLSGRASGAPPDCLIDYFPEDWLLIVDESHIAVPQIRSMFFGDRSRKLNLVKHGFRLPSALDNRPLMSDEFWNRVSHCLFTSATPGRFEAACAGALNSNVAKHKMKKRVESEKQKERREISNIIEENIRASSSLSLLSEDISHDAKRVYSVAPMLQEEIELEADTASDMLKSIEQDRNISALSFMHQQSRTQSLLNRDLSSAPQVQEQYRYVGMAINEKIVVGESDAIFRERVRKGKKNQSKDENFNNVRHSIERMSTDHERDVWWDAEVVIRPTGIVDPVVHLRPSSNQIVDLLQEITIRIKRKERALVTCLTKRMAEDLSLFFQSKGLKSTFLHSGVKPMERLEVIRSLRRGDVDIIVGVNLLREGLNLPEVSLVAILDADKEGFLRSDTALIQTIGRASRNTNGEAILYADRLTGSMLRAVEETERRRTIQQRYNLDNNIIPTQAYSTTAEDRILDMVELQAILDGKVQPDTVDLERLSQKLEGGRLAYTMTQEEEILSGYTINEDVELDITKLQIMQERANQEMLEASHEQKYDLAAKLRDKRDEFAKLVTDYNHKSLNQQQKQHLEEEINLDVEVDEQVVY